MEEGRGKGRKQQLPKMPFHCCAGGSFLPPERKKHVEALAFYTREP
jgi:hypothetical protein